MRIRRTVLASDRPAIESILRATGFFNDQEIAVAMELVDDRIANGASSHYRFLIAEGDDSPLAYGCWGPIPGTVTSADFYWLAVRPDLQGQGVGRRMVEEVERWAADEGRGRLYIETATRPQYAPTRAFYLSCGYRLAAELEDYYAPGDGKAIYIKLLS